MTTFCEKYFGCCFNVPPSTPPTTPANGPMPNAQPPPEFNLDSKVNQAYLINTPRPANGPARPHRHKKLSSTEIVSIRTMLNADQTPRPSNVINVKGKNDE